jgi:hypothetical protein
MFSGIARSVAPGFECVKVFFGIERGHAAGSCRGDRLAVDMIHDIARSKDTLDRCRVALPSVPLLTLI